MFRTKKDVERHVADVLSKIDNENEKHLRGYNFARLFYQVRDYESARKYLTDFQSLRDHHAASHKLMAQIHEATNNPESALQSYKRSLEIDPQQNEIVLKICELYCQLPVDHETARYWADRAEQQFPHHDIVFKLREYLVSAEGEPDRHELEKLIATDLAAQPRNVDRRIKLLRLYLDTERVKEAYDHATMIESKRLFPYSVDWYYMLGDIFEAYQEELGDELDSQFYINYLTAMDHLTYLTLAEPHAFVLENGKKSSSLNDAAAVLLIFDQLLKRAVEANIKEGSWTYFVHHMKGQLYFHMTSLLMKRAKMDQANRKEAFRFSAGLALVCYTFKPSNLLHEVWFSQMESNQKTFTNFFQQSSLRTSFIGHVLLSLCKDDKGSWLQKIKTEVCIPQVKERIYSRIYSSLSQKEKLSSSYFISDTTFEQCSLELPSEMVLKEYDKSAYKLCPDSLHHLVWLELHRENLKISSSDTILEIFKNLQYGNKNLSKGSCESLCVLDLEAYLCAAVYQSRFIIERKNSVLNTRNESFLSYPPDIVDALCTTAQAAWWKAAYGLFTSSIKEKLGEHRRNLQQGLEVIRGVGSHGMEIQLVIHLAHFFSSKADALEKVSENKTDKNKNKLSSENVIALHFRATHYWNIALGMLEKLMSGKSLNVLKNPLFFQPSKPLSKNDIKALKEEGELYLAVRLMESDKLNEAAEMLSKLSSAYGSYYLALTLKKLASDEQRFSSTRTALLNKAKASLHETLDRIKDDKTHPLNKEIYIELEAVENDIAVELSVTAESICDDPDEVDAYDESSINSLSSHSLFENDKSTCHSTPRPSSKFLSSRRSIKTISQMSPSKHFEPSPERLDAQIRALSLNQDTFIKSVLQQQQLLLETNKSIVEALQQNKDAVEQLKKQLEQISLTDLRLHPKIAPKKPIYKAHIGQGDEEDYFDPNGILDYYEDGGEDFRSAGYNFDHSRLAHEAAPGATASLNYVAPPALPLPGPPPALNHYNYQYPPHAMLPTPPSAVPERPPYYHPPPGQGLPFNEGQQLPQFHFHVASSIGKPPPPPLSTSLPQVAGIPPSSVSMPALQLPPVSHLPPTPVAVPPIPVTFPPPAAVTFSLAKPIIVPAPWAKPVSVPHAFQIPLPPSTVVSGSSSVTPVATQVTSTATTSHSQLKNLLETPPVSKTITFGQPVDSTPSAASAPSIFSGLNRTPETPKERTRYDSETATSPDIDLEKEVMGDFKPLIPLPAEIVVETGEENEDGLFEDRAKLYRFVDQEWKERGIGVVKILHNEVNGQIRLLMRRDQVLKVCANHYITSNMEIHPMKNSDKAWTWVAQDFADEELRPEHFCIRFKTPEIAAAFKAAFEKALNISKNNEAKKVTSPKLSSTVTKPFGTKFLPKPGSWTCPTCYVGNPSEKLLCVACETKKPGGQTSASPSVKSSVTITPVATTPAVNSSGTSDFGAKFLPKPGSWVCSACYVSNPADKLLCAACESKKPGTQASVPTSQTATLTNASETSNFGTKFLPKPGSWTCTTCYVSNTSDKLACAACETTKPGSQMSVTSTTSTASSAVTSDFSSKPFFSSTTSSSFTFGGQTNLFSTIASSTTGSMAKSVFGGFTFTSNPVIQEEETPEAKDREILVVSTKSKNGPQVTKVNTVKTSPFSGFTFKSPVTATSSSQASTISNSSPFAELAFKSTMAPSSTSSLTSTATTTNSSNTGLSGLQNLVQNISPAFVFSKSTEKEGNAIRESEYTLSKPGTVDSSKDSLPSKTVFGVKPTTQSTATQPPPSTQSTASIVDSVLTSLISDTNSGGEFVFGMKPSTQPTTFTFGLSALPNKTNENVGFKPTFTTTNNAPAMFGGATQKTESSQNASIFGGASTKNNSVQLSSIFGSKTEESQNANLFSGVTPKSSEKGSRVASIFGKLPNLETAQDKPLFGDTKGRELSKACTVPKVESTSATTAPAPIPPQPVFNFGTKQETQGETDPLEFRFGSPQKYEFNFTGVRPRSPTKTPKSPASPSDVEEEEENESFDADNIYFQPVIPLPPKVDVKTGEEGETTLFCKRAKLFRFCSGEWKERGIGDIKILCNEVGKKVRLLMRRDQVLKVCLNHYLTSDITFERRSDKTVFWAATDFSENEASPELFTLRFKTPEFVDEFLAAIESSLNSSKSQANDHVEKAAASFSFKLDNDSKSESLFTPGSLSSRFGTGTFANVQSTTETAPSFGNVSFSFKNTPTSSTFFNPPKEPGTSLKGEKGLQTDADEIQVIYEAVPSPEDVALAKQLQLPATFFLYKNKPACPGCRGCEDFTPAPSTPAKVEEDNTLKDVTFDKTVVKESENNMFNTSNSLSFADVVASKSAFGGSAANQKKKFEGAGTPLFANLNCSAENEGDEDGVAQGPDIHFEPVIPLPELVAVKTGEEDETTIFVHRAKLFRYDGEKGEWKERGIGDMKILKHNESLRFRIILRREQVHKIACNHCITEDMELSPLATSDTALCWNALDYTEGQPEPSKFAVRFKTKDLLQQFKEKFNECREILRKAKQEPSIVNEAPPKESAADTSTESETNEGDDEDDEESEEDNTLFEKRITFEISDTNDDAFSGVGIGVLRVVYDDAFYGYHVYVISDNGNVYCDHIIAIQNVLRIEKKRAIWSAIDLSIDPPMRRRFRATFSSIDAVQEFGCIFEEGKQSAVNSEIVEETDYLQIGEQQT